MPTYEGLPQSPARLCLRAGSRPQDRPRGLNRRRMNAFAARRSTCASAKRLQARLFVLQSGADESRKQGMRLERLGLEFGMELAAQKPRMLRGLDNLHVIFVWSTPGNFESSRNQRFFVLPVELIA